MIKNVTIKNYILAEDVKLDFKKGLQIITGETGAGKSILIGAIELIFGKTGDIGVLKDKTKPAYLEANFERKMSNKLFQTLLKKYDFEEAEAEVFFSKEISIHGRSKSFINGRRVSLPIMKEFRKALFDFHGQRDQLLLLNRKFQLKVIDNYGNLDELRLAFQNLYKQLKTQQQQLRELQNSERDNVERKQLFVYQNQEIEQLNLQEGEDEELQKELSLLEHAEEIFALSSRMEQTVYESENSIYDQINRFLYEITKFENSNRVIKNAAESTREALQNLDEAVSQLRNVRDLIELDEERQTFVEERLNELNKLKQKYKLSVAEILAYQQEIQKKIEHFSSLSETIIQLENEIANVKLKVWKTADLLSQKRKKAASFLKLEIEKNLQNLAIPHAKVDIQFDKIIGEKDFINHLAEMSYFGNDIVEILFSANPGMQLETLENAASGGELSRFLLTIKKIVSDKMDSKIIIFDEIDTGIGGRTAEYMGKFIHSIARHHQVLCLTHLAAVASYATEHYLVEKEMTRKQTAIVFKRLNEIEKKKELARMISGESSQHALNYAEEILKNKIVDKE